MTHQEIREKFKKFMESKGHKWVDSSSLLPTDPSVLFTTAGMQQFKPYYTGEADAQKDFGSLNTASIQKSMRTSDIDEVGDESHLTFFEMMGNFSFGGYWKEEAIQFAHEFITKEMGLAIDYVTVFEGSDVVPKDEESKKIWQSLGITDIREQGMDDVFWGPTGNEGPCGPTTEIYVNGVEIWNIVFNEFFCEGSREELLSGKAKLMPLKTKGIDTGMGLERLGMMVQKKKTIFETDLFSTAMKFLDPGITERDKRVMADHARAAMFLITDGVLPSNKEQGYVLRRLMRRFITLEELYLQKTVNVSVHLMLSALVETYQSIYPNLNFKSVDDVWRAEESKFYNTLRGGLKELEKLTTVDAPSAFRLYESFGLPFEVIKEVGKEKSAALTREAFETERKKAQEISRAGAEKKFGGHGMTGGEMDPKKTRLHTATHIVVAALEKVLGEKLMQAGSDINEERLRFDFKFGRKVTAEELKKAEDMANEAVSQDLPVTWEEMNTDDAFSDGASGAFRHKYGDKVKVYTIGDKANPFSKEICGGPHVTHTGEIGHITITKEESVSGGNRRIRAIIEN